MAARFCSQCGREVASTAQFCPGCGASMAAPGPGGSKVETAAQTTRRFLVPAMLIALAVLVLAVILLATKRGRPVTSAPAAPPAPAILSAPTSPPPAPAVTSAPAQPAAPAVTSAPARPAPTLPPDVAAYLKFLQGIEERRTALSNDTSGATAMLDTAHQMQGDQGDPDQHNTATPGNVAKINQGYAGYTAKWNSLAADFRAVRPPPACQALANSYFTYLTDYAATISKLQAALLNGDMGAAMGAQGAQNQINADAQAADGQLGQLCSGYGVPKPFSIQPEGGSSPLTGL